MFLKADTKGILKASYYAPQLEIAQYTANHFK
jgi:hypothetical protein